MTYATCTSTCQGLGYKYAGAEYSSECFCSNTLAYNATSTQCSMPCSGANAYNCGGPDALTAVSARNFLSVSFAPSSADPKLPAVRLQRTFRVKEGHRGLEAYFVSEP